jgi:hypothetical protein
MAVWTSAGKVKTEVDKAQDELMKYQGAVSAPGVRNTYEGVEELLVYIKEKTEYEKELARAEGKVQDAKAARAEAANRVREFLPAGSQVIYDYHGPAGSWGAPTRYTIHHDAQGNITV